MIQTVEAVVDSSGRVYLPTHVHIDGRRRVLVTILDEPADPANETALLSEMALAEDWNRPEEEAAWQHLQPVK